MAPLASARRRLAAGLGAAALLLLGLLLKPAAPAAPPPTDAPAPMLQQVVEQREAETVFRRMREAFTRVARFAARITPPPLPIEALEIAPIDPARTADRFGVVTGATQVLADVADLEDDATVQVRLGNGRLFEARVAARFPDRALALLEAATGGPLEPPVRATGIAAGHPVFAAAPGAGNEIIAPLFVAHVSERELLTTNALDAFRGMPVFTLEGEVAGILAFEGNRVRLLTLDAALQPPALVPPAPVPIVPQP